MSPAQQTTTVCSQAEFNNCHIGYYTKHYKIIDNYLDANLTANVKDLWYKLKEWSWRTPNNFGEISQRALAKWKKKSVRTIKRYIKKLENKGFIQVIRSFSRTKLNCREVNKYRVCFPKEVQQYVEQKINKPKPNPILLSLPPKTQPKISEPESKLSASNPQNLHHFFSQLRDKNVTYINTKSSININRITTERQKFVKIRGDPPKISPSCKNSVVGCENFETISKAKEETCLEIEKHQAHMKNLERDMEKLEMEKSKINLGESQNYEALRKHGEIEAAIQVCKNKLTAESTALLKASAKASWLENITANAYYVADMEGQKQVNHAALNSIRGKLTACGCEDWQAKLLCNEFAFAVKCGTMVLLYGCLNLFMEGRWTTPRGFNELQKQNAASAARRITAH